MIFPDLTIEVDFGSCTIGENVFSKTNFTSSSETCEAGFWQVNAEEKSQTSCTVSYETSTYCLGGSRVGPKAGYWRLYETADLLCIVQGKMHV